MSIKNSNQKTYSAKKKRTRLKSYKKKLNRRKTSQRKSIRKYRKNSKRGIQSFRKLSRKKSRKTLKKKSRRKRSKGKVKKFIKQYSKKNRRTKKMLTRNNQLFGGYLSNINSLVGGGDLSVPDMTNWLEGISATWQSDYALARYGEPRQTIPHIELVERSSYSHLKNSLRKIVEAKLNSHEPSSEFNEGLVDNLENDWKQSEIDFNDSGDADFRWGGLGDDALQYEPKMLDGSKYNILNVLLIKSNHWLSTDISSLDTTLLEKITPFNKELGGPIIRLKQRYIRLSDDYYRFPLGQLQLSKPAGAPTSPHAPVENNKEDEEALWNAQVWLWGIFHILAQQPGEILPPPAEDWRWSGISTSTPPWRASASSEGQAALIDYLKVRKGELNKIFTGENIKPDPSKKEYLNYFIKLIEVYSVEDGWNKAAPGDEDGLRIDLQKVDLKDMVKKYLNNFWDKGFYSYLNQPPPPPGPPPRGAKEDPADQMELRKWTNWNKETINKEEYIKLFPQEKKNNNKKRYRCNG